MKQQSNGMPENLLPHEVDPDRSAYKDQDRPLRLGVASLGECQSAYSATEPLTSMPRSSPKIGTQASLILCCHWCEGKTLAHGSELSHLQLRC
jgi:hypothetical protein